ncbi:MAG TPA: (Fe-S)-binding protein [Candidatus Angelobacter sp.]|jgi:Fe-S oxidoreductase|nr:(Fe-S)-binding protein [Candidatus Angelobacter sp.]
MTELLAPEQVMAARRCSSCPKMCRSACPTQAVTGNERHQPWGHARQVVAAERRGDAGFVDPELVDGVYACATCSACTPPCHVDGVETPLLTWAARAAVHRAGATPPIGLEAVRQAQAGNVPAAEGAQWTDPSGLLDELRTLATPGAELLLFPGCGALGRRPQAVLSAATALSALGVAFDLPEQHRCCGMVARTFGDEAAATEMRDAVLAAAEGRELVVQSPSCSYWLGAEPLAATLARALQGREPTARTATVTYHDPCYLARHQRIRDEPRQALAAAGYQVEELRRHGDTTQCSGRGGGLPLTHPDIAAGYLQLLVDDIAAAGADRVVTGCASCATALHNAGVAAEELSEAIAANLEAEP